MPPIRGCGKNAGDYKAVAATWPALGNDAQLGMMHVWHLRIHASFVTRHAHDFQHGFLSVVIETMCLSACFFFFFVYSVESFSSCCQSVQLNMKNVVHYLLGTTVLPTARSLTCVHSGVSATLMGKKKPTPFPLLANTAVGYYQTDSSKQYKEVGVFALVESVFW